MFKKLKQLLGVAAPEVKDSLDHEAAALEKIEKAEKVTEVTVKASKEPTQKAKRETRKSLDKLTKKAIDDLALERFGVELDRRKTKTQLIEDFMKAQKEAK